MDGPQDLSYDQPIQIRHKIQRVADLVRDIYFVFTLPDIYCKYIDLQIASQQQPPRYAQYNFAWVNFIGCHVIQNIAFFIGGSKIQEYDGDYMIAKAQCDLDAYSYKKWQNLVGDINDLTDPANGTYGGGSTGVGYPLVYNNNGPSGSTTTPVNTNRPSIAGRRIQVPLPFWFSESSFEALPLVSLQLHECEIQITLRPISELYTVLDSNGYQVAPGNQYVPSYIPTQPLNVQYIPAPTTDVSIDNFLTDVGQPNPVLKKWALNPSIQMTYIYITDEERVQFSEQRLQYIIRQITSYSFDSIVSRQFVELDVHNPIERIILLPRRSDSLLYRNQVANFTNWINPMKSPYIPNDGGWSSYVNLTSSSGRFVINGQQSIMNTLTVLGDGNPLQEEKPYTYFTDVVPYKYLTGIPSPNILVYPFALATHGIQPCGSINSSRIKSLQLDLNVFPLPTNTLYQYTIEVYVESLNWVTIGSGMGGLKYAL